MTDYKVTIVSSSKELTARDRLRMKDLTNAVKFDELVKPGEIYTLTPETTAVLSVHNPKLENPDYTVYIVADADGNKFYTSSESFWTAFKDIAQEMGEEAFEIQVYKVESKNYKGKHFITCSIA